MKFTLKIPNPCSENWNEMTSTEKGKFCAVCEKDLVDFRTLSTQAIYDAVATDKKVCGRFSVDQLNKEFYAENNNRFSRLGFVVGFTSLVSFVQPVNAQVASNSIQQQVVLEDSNEIQNIDGNTIRIKGIVSENGEPIPFVSVIIRNSDTIVTQTDFDGAFVLEIPKSFFENEVFLEVNYIGCQKQKIVITEISNDLRIELMTDDRCIKGDVVIVQKPSLFKRFINLFRRKENRRYH